MDQYLSVPFIPAWLLHVFIRKLLVCPHINMEFLLELLVQLSLVEDRKSVV